MTNGLVTMDSKAGKYPRSRAIVASAAHAAPVVASAVHVLVVATVLMTSAGLGGCTMGAGDGEVESEQLHVSHCMNGPFKLGPTFFAGVPYRRRFLMRIQRGGDLQEFSDGLSVLVDDVRYIDANLGEPIKVGLPSSVEPVDGEPGDNTERTPVHLALYLHRTCRQQISTLYALRGVIVFQSIFNGDPYEPSPEKRLTSAKFDVVVGDPRSSSNAGDDSSSDWSTDHVRQSRLKGWFQFYFERGQPGQPFP